MHGKRRRRSNKFRQQHGLCHWCNRLMVLSVARGAATPDNYATFEHIVRRREGGAGLPGNVVLACYLCNNSREWGLETSQMPTEGPGWSLEAAAS